jgi:glycosyltransferase involved in cell wall biosynthesis
MKEARDPLDVLVIEPHAEGHHGPYLQWMVEALVERHHQVTVMTLGESLTHPILKRMVSASPHAINVVSPVQGIRHDKSLSGVFSQLIRELSYWRMFRDWYRYTLPEKKPDVVLVPYLDYCLYAIGLLGSPFGNTPWVGVAMRPSFHYRDIGIVAPKPRLAGLKKTLFIRLLKNKHMKNLLTIDEPLIEYLRVNGSLNSKVSFLPEPYDIDVLPTPDKAKMKYGFDTRRKLILVYGSITMRKGVTALLRAVSDQACPEFVDVLFAGKLNEDVRELLSEPWMQVIQKTSRLTVIDRYIAPEEEPILFSAADIVWLGYHGHYTGSGVLVQAAKFGRPVIGCGEGIIGWQVRRHKIGVVIDQNDISSVIFGIQNLVENEKFYEECEVNCFHAFDANNLDMAKNVLVNSVL